MNPFPFNDYWVSRNYKIGNQQLKTYHKPRCLKDYQLEAAINEVLGIFSGNVQANQFIFIPISLLLHFLA